MQPTDRRAARAKVPAPREAPIEGRIGPGRWRFWLPVHFARVNALMRMHWAGRNRTLGREAMWVALACAFAGIPPATGRRRVTQRITLVGNDRRRDDDGAWKGLLDGLVKARVLVDDGPDWVETAPVEYDRGKRRKTAVTIEDAEPAEPAGSEG
jgi:hypothetical protein